MPKSPPIDKRSFDFQAAEWIRNAVLSGELEPGARITELGFATRIGLSRSTVRTAMQRLATEGLLVQHAYAGWEVTSLSAEDAWELYTLRCGMEGLAARLATERIDVVGRQALCNALGELKRAIEAEDRRSVAEADLGLHRAIVAASQHRRLAKQYAQIIDPIQLYVVSTNRDNYDSLYAVHEELVDAILAGNASQAERLACEHMRIACEQLVDRLRRAESAAGPSQHTVVRATVSMKPIHD